MATFEKGGNSLESEINRIKRKIKRYFWYSFVFLFISVIAVLITSNLLLLIPWYLFNFVTTSKRNKFKQKLKISEAGKLGELLTQNVLQTLPDTYRVISDATITFEDRASQIDHIVVGPTGIFIVETKYWNGEIRPSTSGKTVLKVSRSGKSKEHYHPSRQVSTHVYRLASMLKKSGHNVWVQGCVYFSSGDTELHVKDENYPLYASSEDLLDYLLNGINPKRRLNRNEVQSITNAINQYKR